MNKVHNKLIGIGETNAILLASMSNRHGLITGATGTGKTITLKVMAEYFSSIGVPVFLADIKGDLASLAEPGILSDKMQERLDLLGIASFRSQGYPIRLWDVFGKEGHFVRVTVTEMGPLLLSRILGLNDTQEGILNIVFRLADDEGWLLIDLKDLKAILRYVGENAKEVSLNYGNVTKQSVGTIQRTLLRLEDQGGDKFFGEPSLEIKDFIITDSSGMGIINILSAESLFHSPILYSSFLLWMLSELFEELPEVGDLEKPKMVFFFDEAHLLFDEAPKALLDKIEQVVRLIRSKGVGVFFCTQNPIDIPDKVLGQLGNRVQHALRAYTPRDEKAVKSAADTFRQNEKFKVIDIITELKTGEALVSFLDEDGRPSIVERVYIVPPKSLIGTLNLGERRNIIEISPMKQKYDNPVDRESAFEILTRKFEDDLEENKKIQEEERLDKERLIEQKSQEKNHKEEERKLKEEQRAREKAWKNNPINKIGRSTMTSITCSIGRSISRGILGSIKKGLK